MPTWVERSATYRIFPPLPASRSAVALTGTTASPAMAPLPASRSLWPSAVATLRSGWQATGHAHPHLQGKRKRESGRDALDASSWTVLDMPDPSPHDHSTDPNQRNSRRTAPAAGRGRRWLAVRARAAGGRRPLDASGTGHCTGGTCSDPARETGQRNRKWVVRSPSEEADIVF
jgi:hypothetical protein